VLILLVFVLTQAGRFCAAAAGRTTGARETCSVQRRREGASRRTGQSTVDRCFSRWLLGPGRRHATRRTGVRLPAASAPLSFPPPRSILAPIHAHPSSLLQMHAVPFPSLFIHSSISPQNVIAKIRVETGLY